MATGSIGLPQQLITKINEAAAQEKITPEAFVQDAVEVRLRRAEWRRTLDYGERKARTHGFVLEDVDIEVSAVRAEQ